MKLLSKLNDESVDLIYVDPPFNTGRTKSRRGPTAEYPDYWPDGMAGYLDFLTQRIEQFRRVLKQSGTLYMHLDWHAVHYAKIELDRIFGIKNFLGEIIWHYRSGGVSKKWFGRKHDTILAYARDNGRHTFHVAREGSYRTDGLNRDDDGRLYKNTRKGRLYFNPQGPTLSDVWDIPFLSTVSLERTGYPTQKPESLLRRIVTASSNEGDLVADFFCGSGTTLLVAAQMNRRVLGCDQNEDAVRITRQRLAQLKCP